MTTNNEQFLSQDRTYRTLKCFQKAECIYDITFYFAHRFLERGDRTIDQMVQAARSGKQNLAEGNIDGVTSKEMELKLTNVNRASLHELLLDYEDYLRVRGLEHWGPQDPRYQQTAAFCRTHLDSAVYRQKIQERSDETIANIAITLIHQCDRLIVGLIEWLKRDFVEKGGIKEQMYQARKNWQQRNGCANSGGGFSGFSGYGGFSGYSGYHRNGGTPTTPTAPTTPTTPTAPTTPTTPTTPTAPTKPDDE